MSYNDYGNAAGREFELLPDKTLVKAVLSVDIPKANKPYEGMEQITNTGARYIRLTAKIAEGQYIKRNLFGMLCTRSDGSEGSKIWFEGGREQIANLLEQVANAHRDNNPSGYRIGTPNMEHRQLIEEIIKTINGKEVVIQVRIEKAEEGSGYEDKNTFKLVSKWGKLYEKYRTGGAKQGAAPTAPAATSAPSAASFGNGPAQAPVNAMNAPPPSFIDMEETPPFE